VFAVLAVAAVLGVAVLLGSLWLEHRTAVELPALTGRFAVGRAVYDWRDERTRELLVWIWYPSSAGPSAAADDYLPPRLRAEVERARPPLISRFLTRDLSKVRIHSTRNPDVSPLQQSFPVVILRAGASAEVWNYSALAEDLASHGYVVVGFDTPYRTGLVVFPDGRVFRRSPDNDPERWSAREREHRASALLDAWTADAAFVLDRLERLNTTDADRFRGRLDMTRVGIFGHSFGGAAAAQFCREDPRCRAGVDVDGALHGRVIEAGIDRPFLFLLSDHGGESDPESLGILANIQSVYGRLPANGRLRVVINGANHFTFTDDGALLKSRLLRGVLRLFGKLRIGGRRQLEVTSYCLHTFFDAYLKEADGSPIRIASPRYPELRAME